MDTLELYALRRQQAVMARKLELLEAILERSGILDAIVHGPQVDPAPDDLGRIGGIAGLAGAGLAGAGGLGGFGPQVDPAPDDVVRWVYPNRINLAEILRRFRPGDPAPIDISRFTKVQLEGALHSIAAERARLESMEGLIKEQLANLGKG
jgi:hypothetical protein